MSTADDPYRPVNTPIRATNITHQFDDGELQPVDQAATVQWADVLGQLTEGGTFWLTVTVDGRPHTRPVFAVIADGVIHVASSASAAKTRSLRSASPTSIALGAAALDIVWSGSPHAVTHLDQLRAVVEAYRSAYGWDVDTDAARATLTAPYGAPTAGPPPYHVFRIDPDTVHAIATDTPFAGCSTRWDFDPPRSD